MPKHENLTEAQLANIKNHRWPTGVSGNPSGRPKDKAKALLKSILTSTKAKKIYLTAQDINTMEKAVLGMNVDDMQIVVKRNDIPVYLRGLLMAALIDMKNGKSNTIDTLRMRQYGTKVTGMALDIGFDTADRNNTAAPLIPSDVEETTQQTDNTLTQEQALEYIKQLESMY